jgi:hypothetical protein
MLFDTTANNAVSELPSAMTLLTKTPMFRLIALRRREGDQDPSGS